MRLLAIAEIHLAKKRLSQQDDFSIAAVTIPESSVRNLRAGAASAQDCAAIEAASSTSIEAAGPAREHCYSSCYFLDLKRSSENSKGHWHGYFGPGFM